MAKVTAAQKQPQSSSSRIKTTVLEANEAAQAAAEAQATTHALEMEVFEDAPVADLDTL
jgi:hypothetical protein